MTGYRHKDNPLVLLYQTKSSLLSIHIGEQTVTRSIHGLFTDEQLLAAGYYRDVTPTPGEGFEVGTTPTWDEEAGTVAMEIVAKPSMSGDEAREAFKARRQEIVDNIKVTTQAGNTFDGDEISQTRMTRAIVGMQAAGVQTIVWVLADNTVIDATVAELTEALALAGLAQAAAWVP